MKKLIIIISAFIVSACSGTVYTVKSPTFKDNKTKGVLFYGYKPKTVDVVLDRIRHPKTGDITHSMYMGKNTKKYCEPVTQQIIKIVPDYTAMYSVYYEPGLFETSKFGVDLENGTLKSVNSESTPGIKVAVESLGTLVGAVKDTMTFTDTLSTSRTKRIACSSNK